MHKKYILKPEKLFGDIPRIFELIIEEIIVIILGVLWTTIRFYDFYNPNQLENSRDVIIFIIMILIVYYLYKIHRTFTIINEISIDFKNKRLIIKYSFLYILPVKVAIHFQEFSFEVSDGWSFSKGFKKIKIFQNGKKVAKLISKQNGWKKHIVEDVISTFEGIIEYKKKEAVMPQTGNPSKSLSE